MDSMQGPPGPTTAPRLKHFKAWSEQTSSSGKRYYYNKETEVSQWDKPQEWKEYERSLLQQQSTRQQGVGPKTPNTPLSTPQPSSSDGKPATVEAAKTPATPLHTQPNKGIKRQGEHSVVVERRGEKTVSNSTPSAASNQSGQRESATSQQSSSTSIAHAVGTAHFGTPKSSHLSSTKHAANSSSVSHPQSSSLGVQFKEDKYLKFYRADLANSCRDSRAEHCLAEARRLAEKRRAQDGAIGLIDEDIESVQVLLKTAESKSALLGKKLELIAQRIACLEGRNS